MRDWIIILILVTPFALALSAAVVVTRLTSSKLNTPLNLGRIWQRVLSSTLSVRHVIAGLIALSPFVLFSEIIPIPVIYLLVLVGLGYLVYRLANQESNLSEESKEILDALNEITSKMSESRFHVEHLASLVRTKQIEIEQKERIRTDLENQIGEKSREKEDWDKLTKRQQDLVIQAIKKSQSRSVFLSMGIVLGSIALNIVATVIWTLLGNPGRDELMKRFSEIIKVVNH